MSDNRPIGVFDSGLGGLAVLAAIRSILPNENYIYIGDNARLPYGTKCNGTIITYSEQVVSRLVQQNVKMVVVACNTASAHAIDSLKVKFPDTPIIGVIEPTVDYVTSLGISKNIMVLATSGTVASGAYSRAIHKKAPSLHVTEVACDLIVPLVEEGWCEGEIANMVVERYLNGVWDHSHYGALVLGCTHFPYFQNVFEHYIGSKAKIVDSNNSTALSVNKVLNDLQISCDSTSPGLCSLYVTDPVSKVVARNNLVKVPGLEMSSINIIDL